MGEAKNNMKYKMEAMDPNHRRSLVVGVVIGADEAKPIRSKIKRVLKGYISDMW